MCVGFPRSFISRILIPSHRLANFRATPHQSYILSVVPDPTLLRYHQQYQYGVSANLQAWEKTSAIQCKTKKTLNLF